MSILRDLIERNYVKELRSNLAYDVLYGPERVDGTEATVHTVVRVQKQSRKVDTSIDYKLRRDSDRWLVFDVITDEMSLVRTYRSQFNRIIQRESYEALLKKMKRKLAEQ